MDPTGACIPDTEGRGGCGLDPETRSWESYKKQQAPVYEEMLREGYPEPVARYTAFEARYYRPHTEPKKPPAETTHSWASIALTDSGCNVARLFNPGVTCAANQMPPPGGFDLVKAVGDVGNAVTSDCAVGIASALASIVILGTSVYVAAPLIASGSVVTTTVGTAVVSGSVVAAVAIGGQEQNLYNFAVGAYEGIGTC
jgi:hypothetical protein